ncbi:MAG: hypothetical protein PHR53_01470 [Bacteroidales bacterium]|nr:hypothetical protein [Bacteroidales bacterium]
MQIKTITLFIFGLLFGITSFAQTSKGKQQPNVSKSTWNYEIECVGVGNGGTYLIQVWTYSKTPQILNQQDQKNAVHGIIFKGFGAGKGGAAAKAPLVTSPDIEQQYSSYFESFFSDGGNYQKYIASVAQGSTKVIKLGKKSYKIGVVISVLKDQLRKALEDEGIIKSLDSGF